ncbi:hypothetical protein KKC1_23050 [Calderihabitans maritimus]|uniref:Uncharacterized protein n=1 Tax=Calderihabitans maritimus TaxID=1246530 RepID=A0A1Z5HUG6_9FIRM|nr:hypothetical protein KKC1_23050 [Calderihabitans maritimus]
MMAHIRCAIFCQKKEFSVAMLNRKKSTLDMAKKRAWK